MPDDHKLPQLTPIARTKIGAVLTDMEAHGWKPRIAEGLRTVAQQREKVRLGYSKTMKSKHLPGPDGLGRAADIIEAGLGWNSPRAFWLTLGRCALLHGLEWGGLWIGSALSPSDRRMRAALKAFCMDKTRPWEPGAWKGKLGWDVAHVEWPR